MIECLNWLINPRCLYHVAGHGRRRSPPTPALIRKAHSNNNVARHGSGRPYNFLYIVFTQPLEVNCLQSPLRTQTTHSSGPFVDQKKGYVWLLWINWLKNASNDSNNRFCVFFAFFWESQSKKTRFSFQLVVDELHIQIRFVFDGKANSPN